MRGTASGPLRPAPLTGAPNAEPSLPDACTRTPHPFQQPLAVTEDTGLDRYPPVIGFPIPFPRSGQLQSLTGFEAITVDGAPLPTQMEVLSRWGDGPVTCEAPIRWGYGYVLAQAPPNSRAFFGLRHQPETKPATATALTVLEDRTQVIIDTGPARFTVRRDWFNGLSKVELRTPTEALTVVDVPSRSDVGMLIDKRQETASPIDGEVLSFELERAGPIVATIAVKGTYAIKNKPQLYRYTLRLHFYAGTAAVQIDHTYYNGSTENISAEGAKNRRYADRVYYRLPLTKDGAPVVQARGAKQLHGVSPTDLVSVVQYKRTPKRPQVVFGVNHGKERLEAGTYADNPFLAVNGQKTYAIATMAHMGFRDPQALRYDPKRHALELDWQSEGMFIGGARGIWGKAVIDFGLLANVDVVSRADQLYAHVSRPMVAVPRPAYLNETHAFGPLPEGELPVAFDRLDQDIDRLHRTTVDYLRRYKITGTQLWPDLSRDACSLSDSCKGLEDGYFEGGDNNYWDWSFPEFEAFVRTTDPAFLHDFALGEAMTMAETISFRPDWYTKSGESSFAGLSPCYGSARGWGGPWVEGLSHRTGNCPGDYGYNKVFRLAYILTADRRFTDLFTDGAETAIRQYGTRLLDRPPDWRELSVSRQTSQYFEPLLTAAEFGRIGGDKKNRRFRDVALKYFDFMKSRALQNGHSCNLIGSGFSDPKVAGTCTSAQQWMLPIFVDWVVRLYYLYNHGPAGQWVIDWVRQSIRQTTVLNDGLPDISELTSSSDTNRENGWRTIYYCKANRKSGIRDKTCKKVTEYENNAYYYPNGLVAYLNAIAMARELDPKDELRLCQWLPKAYARALAGLRRNDMNDYVWGKSPGQAYAFSQRAAGLLSACP